MAERREQFDEIANRAVGDREHARATLASDLVMEIRTDLASFDPMRLQALGPDGVKALLRELELDPATEKGGAREPAPPAPSESTIKGWADMRRAEPSAWLEAVLSGTGIALLIVLATALATTFWFSTGVLT